MAQVTPQLHAWPAMQTLTVPHVVYESCPWWLAAFCFLFDLVNLCPELLPAPSGSSQVSERHSAFPQSPGPRHRTAPRASRSPRGVAEPDPGPLRTAPSPRTWKDVPDSSQSRTGPRGFKSHLLQPGFMREALESAGTWGERTHWASSRQPRVGRPGLRVWDSSPHLSRPTGCARRAGWLGTVLILGLQGPTDISWLHVGKLGS